jgi:transposase
MVLVSCCAAARRWFPFIERIFADAGYQGPKMAKVVADTGCWTLQIVKRAEEKSAESSGVNKSAKVVLSCNQL